jgi:hypothetical protein
MVDDVSGASFCRNGFDGAQYSRMAGTDTSSFSG